MSEHQLTWALVDETAAALGASDYARRKWRQDGRGVPAIWRIRIAEALAKGGRAISIAAFEHLETNPGRIAA